MAEELRRRAGRSRHTPGIGTCRDRSPGPRASCRLRRNASLAGPRHPGSRASSCRTAGRIPGTPCAVPLLVPCDQGARGAHGRHPRRMSAPHELRRSPKPWRHVRRPPLVAVRRPPHARRRPPRSPPTAPHRLTPPRRAEPPPRLSPPPAPAGWLSAPPRVSRMRRTAPALRSPPGMRPSAPQHAPRKPPHAR